MSELQDPGGDPVASVGAEPAARPSGAICARHDTAASEFACARCGNFACNMCRAPGHDPPICVPCYERVGESGLAHHISALSIVTMIHGALLVLAGLFLVVAAFGIGLAFVTAPTLPQTGELAAIGGFATLIYLGLAIVLLVPGVLQLVAGWRIRTFHNRGLAIAAYLSALPAVLFCYCAPSIIGLAIWGLVVLLDEGTGARFKASAAQES